MVADLLQQVRPSSLRGPSSDHHVFSRITALCINRLSHNWVTENLETPYRSSWCHTYLSLSPWYYSNPNSSTWSGLMNPAWMVILLPCWSLGKKPQVLRSSSDPTMTRYIILIQWHKLNHILGHCLLILFLGIPYSLSQVLLTAAGLGCAAYYCNCIDLACSN